MSNGAFILDWSSTDDRGKSKWWKKLAFPHKRFRYSEDDVVGYLVQILQGVEYLHNHRVLHLDLKPDNIIVTNLNAVKIVDFGSAQSFNPLSLKHQDSGAGTLEYMGEDKTVDWLPLMHKFCQSKLAF